MVLCFVNVARRLYHCSKLISLLLYRTVQYIVTCCYVHRLLLFPASCLSIVNSTAPFFVYKYPCCTLVNQYNPNVYVTFGGQSGNALFVLFIFCLILQYALHFIIPSLQILDPTVYFKDQWKSYKSLARLEFRTPSTLSFLLLNCFFAVLKLFS